MITSLGPVHLVSVIDDADPDVCQEFDHAFLPNLLNSVVFDIYAAIRTECHPDFLRNATPSVVSLVLPLSLEEEKARAARPKRGLHELAVLLPWLVPRVHAMLVFFNLSIDDADTQDLLPFLLHHIGPGTDASEVFERQKQDRRQQEAIAAAVELAKVCGSVFTHTLPSSFLSSIFILDIFH